MAYDLEERESIDQMKAWWDQWGTPITAAVCVCSARSWAMARASGRLMVTLLTFRLLPVRGSDERRVTTV